MGWFEEQIEKRKKLDEKTFEESFMSLAGLGGSKNNSSDMALREDFAIGQILSFYRHPSVEIPAKIKDFNEKINYAILSLDISYHKIEITAEWLRDNFSPVLVFIKDSHIPVVLLPKGDKGYYYVHYHTGKKSKVN